MCWGTSLLMRRVPRVWRKLVTGHPDWPAGLVAEVDVPLPAPQLGAQGGHA